MTFVLGWYSELYVLSPLVTSKTSNIRANFENLAKEREQEDRRKAEAERAQRMAKERQEQEEARRKLEVRSCHCHACGTWYVQSIGSFYTMVWAQPHICIFMWWPEVASPNLACCLPSTQLDLGGARVEPRPALGCEFKPNSAGLPAGTHRTLP